MRLIICECTLTEELMLNIFMLSAICVIQSLYIMPRYFIKILRLVLGKLFKNIILA